MVEDVFHGVLVNALYCILHLVHILQVVMHHTHVYPHILFQWTFMNL